MTIYSLFSTEARPQQTLDIQILPCLIPMSFLRLFNLINFISI